MARLHAALALAAEIKPPELWRAAYVAVEHIRVACQLASKTLPTPSERAEQVAALRAQGEIVVKHWSATGLYGFEAAERMKRFSK